MVYACLAWDGSSELFRGGRKCIDFVVVWRWIAQSICKLTRGFAKGGFGD